MNSREFVSAARGQRWHAPGGLWRPVDDAAALGRLVMIAAGAIAALLALLAWCDLPVLLPVLLVAPLALVAVVALRHPRAASVAWLLVAGTSPEMWLGAILPGSESTDTALVKLAGLALVAVCIVRYGWRFDLFNPGLAFLAMFLIGLAHGLLPQLGLADSLRSLIGSAAPFAFGFSRLSRRWCHAMVIATIWVSPVIVAFGALLAGLHLYPMFAEDDGIRLAGSTHPAFLAGFAMTGVYAALIELFRDGRTRHQVALVLNFVILAAAGGRSPLFCAVAVSGFAFLAVASPSFPRTRRLPAMLLGGIALAAAAAVASLGSEVRILNVLSTQAANLSNRDLIWPYFVAAFDASPWVGWGVGASKVLVDPDSLLAHLLGTTAAHDEYLRIGVEGGYVGLVLLIGSLAAWVILATRQMWRGERIILRLILLAFALQSVTDNTLIAATASVYFTWMTAVFARGRLELAASAQPQASLPPVVVAAR